MEKTDKRVKRTHKLLAAALLELADEKDYVAITIKDITERAEVAYITFFRHYESKDDLLMNLLQDIIAEIEAMAHGSEQPFEHKHEARLTFEHVQSHASLYYLLLNNPGTATARKSVKEMLAKTIFQHLQDHKYIEGITEIPIEIGAHHIAASLLALIEWWLDNNMLYPPEQMAEIYHQVVLKPILRSEH